MTYNIKMKQTMNNVNFSICMMDSRDMINCDMISRVFQNGVEG